MRKDELDDPAEQQARGRAVDRPRMSRTLVEPIPGHGRRTKGMSDHETPEQAAHRHKDEIRAYNRERKRRWRAAKGMLPRASRIPLTEEERKARELERYRRRRAASGARPQSESLSRTKPWERLGMARSTWYARGKPEPDNATIR